MASRSEGARSAVMVLVVAVVLISSACSVGDADVGTTGATPPAGTEAADTEPGGTSTSTNPSTTDTTEGSTSTTEGTTAETPSASSGPSVTLEGILDREIVRVAVGSDMSVFRIDPESSTPSGFEMALAAEVASVLAPGTAVEFTIVPGSRRYDALAAGEYDMAMSLTVNYLSREDWGEFSIPYLPGGMATLVDAESGISSIQDLEGKTIAVQEGRTDETLLRDALDAAGVTAAITPMSNFAQVQDAVTTSKADAGAMSYPVAIALRSRSPIPLSVIPIDLLRDPIAIVTPRGDVTFQQAVNEALQTVVDDGTWLTLFEEWIGSSPPFTVEEMAGVPAS